MAKLMMGTEEVLKVMMGSEEVTSLFAGSEEIPITPIDCEGDPECLCTQGGGTWTYDDMTDTYYCDCGGDPECECISAGGEWDGSDCVYPE